MAVERICEGAAELDCKLTDAFLAKACNVAKNTLLATLRDYPDLKARLEAARRVQAAAERGPGAVLRAKERMARAELQLERDKVNRLQLEMARFVAALMRNNVSARVLQNCQREAMEEGIRVEDGESYRTRRASRTE